MKHVFGMGGPFSKGKLRYDVSTPSHLSHITPQHPLCQQGSDVQVTFALHQCFIFPTLHPIYGLFISMWTSTLSRLFIPKVLV